MMVRYATPLLLAAGPALAHGGHGPAGGGWHAFLHLAAPLTFAAMALFAAAALARRPARRLRGR